MKMIMKKKVVISLFTFTIIACLLSLGFNMYFLATKPKAPSGIFNSVKNSVLEIKAESENVGISYGSAGIISEDGTIVTNAHVVTYKQLGEDILFENISVRFIDEEDFREVKIIKYDIDLDIAILKIECDKNLSPIKIGDSNNLQYGDAVYAIGNMSNYGISITTGIVSIPQINVSYEDKIRNVIQCMSLIGRDNNMNGIILQHVI